VNFEAELNTKGRGGIFHRDPVEEKGGKEVSR